MHSRVADLLSGHAVAIAKEIEPLLKGHDPAVQGAVLAWLVSLWIAGYRPEVRPVLLPDWVQMLGELMAIDSEELWGRRGPALDPNLAWPFPRGSRGH